MLIFRVYGSVQSRSKSVGRSRFLTTDLKVDFRSTDLKRLFFDFSREKWPKLDHFSCNNRSFSMRIYSIPFNFVNFKQIVEYICNLLTFSYLDTSLIYQYMYLQTCKVDFTEYFMGFDFSKTTFSFKLILFCVPCFHEFFIKKSVIVICKTETHVTSWVWNLEALLK